MLDHPMLAYFSSNNDKKKLVNPARNLKPCALTNIIFTPNQTFPVCMAKSNDYCRGCFKKFWPGRKNKIRVTYTIYACIIISCTILTVEFLLNFVFRFVILCMVAVLYLTLSSLNKGRDSRTRSYFTSCAAGNGNNEVLLKTNFPNTEKNRGHYLCAGGDPPTHVRAHARIEI